MKAGLLQITQTSETYTTLNKHYDGGGLQESHKSKGCSQRVRRCADHQKVCLESWVHYSVLRCMRACGTLVNDINF